MNSGNPRFAGISFLPALILIRSCSCPPFGRGISKAEVRLLRPECTGISLVAWQHGSMAPWCTMLHRSAIVSRSDKPTRVKGRRQSPSSLTYDMIYPIHPFDTEAPKGTIVYFHGVIPVCAARVKREKES
ncbi:hypothetical protein F5B17DRAFT_389903, partial [Nemania serpens]